MSHCMCDEELETFNDKPEAFIKTISDNRCAGRNLALADIGSFDWYREWQPLIFMHYPPINYSMKT